MPRIKTKEIFKSKEYVNLCKHFREHALWRELHMVIGVIAQECNNQIERLGV